MCIEHLLKSPKALRQAQWLHEINTGSQAAFKRLHADAAGDLLLTIRRMNARVVHEEDVLQESFVKIWQSAASYDPCKGPPAIWMNSIARHIAVDHYRRANSRAVWSHKSITDDDDDESIELVAAFPGQLDLLSRAQDAKAVCACMDKLPSFQRQSLAFAFFHDLSHAEIALELRQPLGTVKSWIRRSLVVLKVCMEQQPPGGRIAS